MEHWDNLSLEQLQGANYALRLVATSPRIRGVALDLINDLIVDTRGEIAARGKESDNQTVR